jgi:hypothetical protein
VGGVQQRMLSLVFQPGMPDCLSAYLPVFACLPGRLPGCCAVLCCCCAAGEPRDGVAVCGAAQAARTLVVPAGGWVCACFFWEVFSCKWILSPLGGTLHRLYGDGKGMMRTDVRRRGGGACRWVCGCACV